MEHTEIKNKAKQKKALTHCCAGLIVLWVIFAIFAPYVYGKTDVETEESNHFYTNELQIQVEEGYETLVRLGRDTSFYITIQAVEADFEGTVIVNIPDAFANTVSYSKQADVTQNHKKCITFRVPVINEWSNYSVEILDSHGASIFYHEFDIDVKTDMESAYVGVLSDEPESLSYFQPENAVVVPMNLDDIHYTMTDWNLFDVLLVDDFDMNQLDAELFQNLLQWVKEGGSLVLGTGENYTKTLQRFLEEGVISANLDGLALSSTLLGMSQNDQTQEEQKIAETQENAASLRNEQVETYVLNFQVENSQILREEDTTLVEELNYGEGNFLLFHVALGEKSFQDHILSVDISKLIINQVSEQRKETLYYSLYDGNVDSYCMNVVKESSDVIPPSLARYIILTVIYLILVGPVLYLVLMKLNRRSLLWVLVPGLTVVFTGIAFVAGSSTRNEKLKSSYFSLLYYENQNIEEHSIFNLTVPFNDAFSVNFDTDTTLQAINDKQYGYYSGSIQKLARDASSNYQRIISEEEDGKAIYLKEIAPFSATYFTANKQYTVDGGYESSIHFSAKGFDGSFTNELGYDMGDTFLISSGSIVSIGTIADGETVNVVQGEGEPLLSPDYYMIANYVEGYLNQNAQESNFVYEKSNAINYIIQNYFKEDRTKSIVVSFVQSNYEEGITNVLKSQSNSLGVEMIVLPVEVNYEDGDTSFVPELGSNYEIIEGGYLLGGDYRYFNGTLTVEYQLPKDAKITAFYYSDFINREFDMDTYSGFSGKIYFYNRNTKKYDQVFQNYGDEVVNLSDYLSSQNKVIVKYKEKREFMEYYMSLPYISYYKEGE